MGLPAASSEWTEVTCRCGNPAARAVEPGLVARRAFSRGRPSAPCRGLPGFSEFWVLGFSLPEGPSWASELATSSFFSACSSASLRLTFRAALGALQAGKWPAAVGSPGQVRARPGRGAGERPCVQAQARSRCPRLPLCPELDCVSSGSQGPAKGEATFLSFLGLSAPAGAGSPHLPAVKPGKPGAQHFGERGL